MSKACSRFRTRGTEAANPAFAAWLALVCAASLTGATTHAETILLTGATVHTVSGPTLTNAQVLIKDGRIAAVEKTIRTRADKTVILRGDKDVLLGDTVKVMSMIKRAGASEIAIAAEAERKTR